MIRCIGFNDLNGSNVFNLMLLQIQCIELKIWDGQRTEDVNWTGNKTDGQTEGNAGDDVTDGQSILFQNLEYNIGANILSLGRGCGVQVQAQAQVQAHTYMLN